MVDPDQDPSVVRRKIATILSADVAEYSRLMVSDEEATLRTFRNYKKIFERLITAHHGRIFNTAGDAILAEFTSAVEAVRCATEVQAALRTRNDQLPEDKQVRFRIGINLGDVLVEGNDLLGDGVNIAARVQTSAAPGGISISGSIYDQIRNKLELSFKPLGEQKYKNIPQPVRTYSISNIGGVEQSVEAPASRFSRRTKIFTATGVFAVLAAGGLVFYKAVVSHSVVPKVNYSGQVCYGDSPSEQARCYHAAGVLSGNTLSAKWLRRNSTTVVSLEGTVDAANAIKIAIDFVLPNEQRVPMANLDGAVKDGHIQAAGKFRHGRTISIDWRQNAPPDTTTHSSRPASKHLVLDRDP